MATLKLIILHEPLPERLHDAAFNLTLDALRVYRTADVVHRPDAEHLHFSRNGIDLDFGNLAAEHISLPRPA